VRMQRTIMVAMVDSIGGRQMQVVARGNKDSRGGRRCVVVCQGSRKRLLREQLVSLGPAQGLTAVKHGQRDGPAMVILRRRGLLLVTSRRRMLPCPCGRRVGGSLSRWRRWLMLSRN
jgi:hypothetical protein